MGMTELVLGHEVRIAILRVLLEADQPMTGRQIARRVDELLGGKSLRAVQAALKTLAEKAKIIRYTKDPISGAHLYRINRWHPFVQQGILPLLEADVPVAENLTKAATATVQALPEQYRPLSATLIDQPDAPLELIVVPRSTIGSTQETVNVLYDALDFLSAETGRNLAIQVMTFADVRDRMKNDTVFRNLVTNYGTSICGSPLTRLASDSLYGYTAAI